jgi:hypothetical protein
MQLQAVKPTDRRLATSSTSIKDPVGVNAGVMADSKRGGVDKVDACTLTQLRVQIGHQWYEHREQQRMQSANSSPASETRCADDGGHTR